MKTKSVFSAIALNAIALNVIALSVCLGIGRIANAQPMNDDNAVVSTGKASADYVTLRLNLKPGSKYRMTQNSRTKMVILAPAMSGRPAQKTEIYSIGLNVLKYDVLWNNPDGTTQIRMTYGDTNNKITVKMNGKTQAQPSNEMTQALVGQKIEMKISPEGQVSDVRGLDSLWEKAFAGTKSPGMTPQMKQQMADTMKKMFGDDFIKSLMQQSGMTYPENPVQIGGSWVQRVETNGQLPFVVNLKRTLQGRANGLVSVGESGTMSIGDAQKTVSVGPAAMKMAITGTYSGTTVLNEATGFTHSAHIAQRYSGSVSTKANNRNISTQLFGLSNTDIQVEKIS